MRRIKPDDPTDYFREDFDADISERREGNDWLSPLNDEQAGQLLDYIWILYEVAIEEGRRREREGK